MSKTKLMVVVVLAGIVALGFASGEKEAKNKIKGQDVFKDFCKPCTGPSPRTTNTPPCR